MRFEFTTATRILFGPGTLRDVASAAKAMGKRALVVTGQSRSRAEGLLGMLGGAGIQHVTFTIAGEPTIQLIQSGTTLARGESVGHVVREATSLYLAEGPLNEEDNLAILVAELNESLPMIEASFDRMSLMVKDAQEELAHLREERKHLS